MNKANLANLARAGALLERARAIISKCQDQEQDVRDRMRDGGDDRKRAMVAEENMNILEEAIAKIEGAEEKLRRIV